MAGTILLIGLTVVIDWTIRLIVINSKLSGKDSFQATVEHCFGKVGLIAISVSSTNLPTPDHSNNSPARSMAIV